MKESKRENLPKLCEREQEVYDFILERQIVDHTSVGNKELANIFEVPRKEIKRIRQALVKKLGHQI